MDRGTSHGGWAVLSRLLGGWAVLSRLLALGDADEVAQDAGRDLEALVEGLDVAGEHDAHVRAHLGEGALLGDVGDEPGRVREGVVPERHDDALRPGLDLLDV